MVNIKLDEYQKKLEEGVKKVLESGNYREFMAFISKFWQYSFNNSILIWCQRPDATYVAGIKTWNSMGRRIMKGEKGIRIAVPLIGKKKNNEGKPDGEDMATEDQASGLYGFRFRSIFDVSQTEGDPLPELETGEVKAYLCAKPAALFEKLVAFSPIPVSVENIEKDGPRGIYKVDDQRIVISSSLDAPSRCKTLFHELSHHLALATDLKDTFEIKNRSSHEVVAEGAAFLVCSHFGIDPSEYSFAYLATWGKDYKKVIALGGAIKGVASRLLEIALAGSEEGEVA